MTPAPRLSTRTLHLVSDADVMQDLDRGPATPVGTPHDRGVAVTEVFRPSAIIPEASARDIVLELALRDARNDGVWDTTPTVWRRYDKPWDGTDALGDPAPGTARLLGTLHVAYAMPTRYEITIFRVTITNDGHAAGCDVETMTDEVLGLGGLTLAQCPRAHLADPPPVWRFR